MVWSGWRSKSAAISVMVVAVAGFILGLVNPEHASALTPEAALTMFLAGFYALGITGKIERIAQASEAEVEKG